MDYVNYSAIRTRIVPRSCCTADVIFSTRSETENIIDLMLDLIEVKGKASLNDFYRACLIDDPHEEVNKNCVWTKDMIGPIFTVKKEKHGGYYIESIPFAIHKEETDKNIRFDLRDWHDECTDNFIVYQYLAKLNCIQELSSTDNFDEAFHHCELYSKRRRREDKIAWLIHDRERDEWFIFEKHPSDGKSMGFYKLS